MRHATVKEKIKEYYRVYKKNVSNPKLLLNSIFCKIMESNSNQWLILDFRCTSKSLLFSYFEFCKQREFKMLNFQVACAKIFQPKNEFYLHCQQIWNDVINL